MSDRADSLDRLAGELLFEARGLDVVADSLEPLLRQVRHAWQGPAAERLISGLGDRQRELASLAALLRSEAGRTFEEARRVRSAEAAVRATIATDLVSPDPSPVRW